MAYSQSEQIETARTALEKWVETERTISKEEQDLKLAKEMLNERIQLVQREIESLREKIRDAEESIAEADEKRDELIQENERLKEASSDLANTLSSFETSTKTLLGSIPGPIKDRVKPLSQRLPENPEEAEGTLSERFQNVIGILNEINKFQAEVTTTSEVRELGDNKTAEVTSMYIGLGQGYYVGANKDIAGLGTIMDEQWGWVDQNSAAAKVHQAIKILENEQVASFVQLPILIK